MSEFVRKFLPLQASHMYKAAITQLSSIHAIPGPIAEQLPEIIGYNKKTLKKSLDMIK